MPEGIPYASSNVIAGTGLELNYVGNHCFAYSGTTGASITSQIVLDFQTGSKLIVGKMITNGAIQFSSGGGVITSFRISLNGLVVAITQIDTQSDHSPSPPKINLVIPPYTNVKVEVDSDDNNASILSTAVFTGKVIQ